MDPSDWLPTLPDLPARRRRLIPEASFGPALSGPVLFPPTDILAGLIFQPIYPDQVPHRRSIVSPAVTAPPLANLPNLAWLSIYPWRPPRARRYLDVQAPSRAVITGALQVVAASLAWAPQLPPWLPKRRTAQATALAIAHMPATGPLPNAVPASAAGVICLDLADGSMTTPAFVTEALVSTDFTPEALGTTDFTNEDVC